MIHGETSYRQNQLTAESKDSRYAMRGKYMTVKQSCTTYKPVIMTQQQLALFPETRILVTKMILLR